jgi:hypothetical protein
LSKSSTASGPRSCWPTQGSSPSSQRLSDANHEHRNLNMPVNAEEMASAPNSFALPSPLAYSSQLQHGFSAIPDDRSSASIPGNQLTPLFDAELRTKKASAQPKRLRTNSVIASISPQTVGTTLARSKTRY